MSTELSKQTLGLIEKKSWEYSQFDKAVSVYQDAAKEVLTDPAIISSIKCDGWVSVEDAPLKNGIYLIWENGIDEAHYKDGKWISVQPTERSTSPYLKSLFRVKIKPTHWREKLTPPNQ